MTRPQPPQHVLDALHTAFAPSPDLERWARQNFLEPASPLFNEENAHLQMASIGFVWTNEPNARAGRTVIGQCELMPPMAMGKWQKARAVSQIEQWFDGMMPHFLITISAQAAEFMDDASFMALIYHELLHAGQARDEFGMPKFRRDGMPVWAIRGHDVQEFVSVVRLFGADACGAAEFVEAANETPQVSRAQIQISCGNCLTKMRP